MTTTEPSMRELIRLTELDDSNSLPSKTETLAHFEQMLNKDNLTDEQRAVIEETQRLALRLYDDTLLSKTYNELTEEEKQLVEIDFREHEKQFKSYLQENTISSHSYHSAWLKHFDTCLLAKILLNTPKDEFDAELDVFLKGD